MTAPANAPAPQPKPPPRHPPQRILIELSTITDFIAATLVGNGAAWSEATLQAIKAPANAHAKANLKVGMFSSIIWYQMLRILHGSEQKGDQWTRYSQQSNHS